MDINKNVALFPYIEGDMLYGKKDQHLTIAAIEIEELPGHNGKMVEKVCVAFRETPKKLVLNKTNAKRIRALHGPETDEWKGKKITLYAEQIKAFGEWMNVVRVRQNAKNGDKPMPVKDAIQAVTQAVIDTEKPPDEPAWDPALDAAKNG